VTLEIAVVPVADLMADTGIDALVAEYEAEAKSAELPPAQPQWDQYAAWEQAGVFVVITARRDGRLIGLISVLDANLPHYVAPLCVTESLFVSAAHRRTRAGRALIDAAKTIAKSKHAALLITARAGSALEAILPRTGFRHSNTVFIWRSA
jgi:GNAT superfamily N-acetyltransferase